METKEESNFDLGTLGSMATEKESRSALDLMEQASSGSEGTESGIR